MESAEKVPPRKKPKLDRTIPSTFPTTLKDLVKLSKLDLNSFIEHHGGTKIPVSYRKVFDLETAQKRSGMAGNLREVSKESAPEDDPKVFEGSQAGISNLLQPPPLPSITPLALVNAETAQLDQLLREVKPFLIHQNQLSGLVAMHAPRQKKISALAGSLDLNILDLTRAEAVCEPKIEDPSHEETRWKRVADFMALSHQYYLPDENKVLYGARVFVDTSGDSIRRCLETLTSSPNHLPLISVATLPISHLNGSLPALSLVFHVQESLELQRELVASSSDPVPSTQRSNITSLIRHHSHYLHGLGSLLTALPSSPSPLPAPSLQPNKILQHILPSQPQSSQALVEPASSSSPPSNPGASSKLSTRCPTLATQSPTFSISRCCYFTIVASASSEQVCTNFLPEPSVESASRGGRS